MVATGSMDVLLVEDDPRIARVVERAAIDRELRRLGLAARHHPRGQQRGALLESGHLYQHQLFLLYADSRRQRARSRYEQRVQGLSSGGGGAASVGARGALRLWKYGRLQQLGQRNRGLCSDSERNAAAATAATSSAATASSAPAPAAASGRSRVSCERGRRETCGPFFLARRRPLSDVSGGSAGRSKTARCKAREKRAAQA